MTVMQVKSHGHCGQAAAILNLPVTVPGLSSELSPSPNPSSLLPVTVDSGRRSQLSAGGLHLEVPVQRQNFQA